LSAAARALAAVVAVVFVELGEAEDEEPHALSATVSDNPQAVARGV
jgi:hypothetical protein